MRFSSPLYSARSLRGAEKRFIQLYSIYFRLSLFFFFLACTKSPVQHSYSLQLLYCAVASYYSAHFSFECKKPTLKNRLPHLPYSAHITESLGEGAEEKQSLRKQQFTHQTQRPLVAQQMSD